MRSVQDDEYRDSPKASNQGKRKAMMTSIKPFFTATIISAAVFFSAGALAAGEMNVKITPDIASVEVMRNGKTIIIMRNQDENHTVSQDFAKTSRKCPPFCVQPYSLAPGVETIGEIEMLDYLSRMSKGDGSILVIDSRTPDWVKKGTIPGSVNIPWTSLNPGQGADPMSIAEILENKFGAVQQEGLWDFSKVKTLVLFCNGMWCGQSPNNIQTLLRFGYPAEKIKWYRGGMQDWEILGLTTAAGE
jgi:rhodanese-related sulfurtransferase